MAVYIRLDDAVRARLRGAAAGSTSTSSGSEHDASACLSGLVQAFLETENSAALEDPAPKGSGAAAQGHDESADDDGCSASAAAAAAAAAMRELLDPPAAEDPFRIRLAAAVSAALEAEGNHGHGAALRRAMVRRLRAAGYDAGVCKSRWEASGGGLTAGAHEYVDVVLSPSAGTTGTRYIVDAEFRAGMEVARATAEYAAVVAAVPSPAVVAREESLGRAVRVAAEAARRSLRAQGLHVPPWRKSRYMLAKWLGPYKRSPASTASAPTTAMLPAVPAAGMMMEGVKCRAVGFFPPSAPAARIK